MRRSNNEMRLRAIKSRLVLLPTTCEICRDSIQFEKMWKVYRWAVGKRIYPHCYCKKCMNTAQDVIEYIDEYPSSYGIAFVDRYPHN